MNAPAPQPVPMKEMRVANAALGDRAALDAIWDECGYWLFRDVLDKEAVARLRRTYVEVLTEMGFVEPGAKEPIWNGRSLKDFPDKLERLHELRAWRTFTAEPTIVQFFETLLGGPIFWVPIVEYRATPPAAQVWPDPYIGRHQDCFSNEGIPFRTCWVPLTEIDARTGGLAMAEGLQHGEVLHDAGDPPRFPIPREAIPDEAWRRSDYSPGDLVMFSPRIPHAGMPNYSDRRFRLSLDVRIMAASDRIPVVGVVAGIGPDHIVIRREDGVEVPLVLDAETYCRGVTGQRIPTPDMAQRLTLGDPVMAAERDGRAMLLRPQR